MSDVPTCECHGLPKATRGQGQFECVVSKRDRVRKWKRANRERFNEQKRRARASLRGIQPASLYNARRSLERARRRAEDL